MVADALGRLNTQGERVQVMEALASDSSLLLPLLENNAAGLRELTHAAIDSGAALTGIEAGKLEKANRAISDLKQSATDLGQSLAVNLAPYLSDLIMFANQIVDKFAGAEKKVQSFFDNFLASGGALGGNVETLTDKISELESHLVALPVDSEQYKNIEKEIEAKERLLEVAIRAAEIAEQNRNRKSEPITITPDHDPLTPEKPTISDSDQSKLEALEFSLLSEEEKIFESYARRQFFIEDLADNELITQQNKQALIEGTVSAHEKKITELKEKEDKKRVQIEKQAQGQIDSFKRQGLGLAINLLQTLGNEHKGAALAAIAIQKAIAIGQINVDAAKAHMAAETLWSLGPAAPAALAAAHSQIEGVRAASLGFTVASGLMQASALKSSGGASFDTSSGSSPTTGQPLPDPTLGGINEGGAPNQQEFGRQITVIVEGNVFDSDDFRSSIVNAIETAESNDEIRILNAN